MWTADHHIALSGECLVLSLVIGLVVLGLAWAIPPSRPYCVPLGVAAAALYLLFGCLL